MQVVYFRIGEMLTRSLRRSEGDEALWRAAERI
jgi:hypothetical protein